MTSGLITTANELTTPHEKFLFPEMDSCIAADFLGLCAFTLTFLLEVFHSTSISIKLASGAYVECSGESSHKLPCGFMNVTRDFCDDV